jgi:hypothetical protein
VQAGLVNIADDSTFPGGLIAGIFPPVLQDGVAVLSFPSFSLPLGAALTATTLTQVGLLSMKRLMILVI